MKYGLITFVGVMLLPACSDSTPLQSIAGEAQGTTYEIRFWTDQDIDLKQISSAVAKELESIDASMSGYRDDSVIEQFNRQQVSQPVTVDAEIIGLVDQARTVYEASHGCYDLTIKPLFELWGFKASRFAVPSDDAIQAVRNTIGMTKLETVDTTHLRKHEPSLAIDLSSIGQGYSVGRMAQVIEQYGIQNYMAELGGEMLVKGRKPDGQAWRIAIEKPLPEQRTIEKVIHLEGAQPTAIMTSGTYRHFYDEAGVRYSHILDARTGYPVTHNTVSVTVLYPNAALADAWSTALLCLGRESGLGIANQQKIPAFFIEQTGGTLQEHSSEPLRQLQGVRITEP